MQQVIISVVHIKKQRMPIDQNNWNVFKIIIVQIKPRFQSNETEFMNRNE